MKFSQFRVKTISAADCQVCLSLRLNPGWHITVCPEYRCDSSYLFSFLYLLDIEYIEIITMMTFKALYDLRSQKLKQLNYFTYGISNYYLSNKVYHVRRYNNLWNFACLFKSSLKKRCLALPWLWYIQRVQVRNMFNKWIRW